MLKIRQKNLQNDRRTERKSAIYHSSNYLKRRRHFEQKLLKGYSYDRLRELLIELKTPTRGLNNAEEKVQGLIIYFKLEINSWKCDKCLLISSMLSWVGVQIGLISNLAAPGNFEKIIVNDNLHQAYYELRTFILPQIEKLSKYPSPLLFTYFV